MKMEIQSIPIKDINPATYNPRIDLQPGDIAYDHLDKSMTEFGCVVLPVWNRRTGTLVSGHQRLKILKAKGVETIDVVIVDLPLAKEKALNIALNKISGDWDEAKLAALLDELQADIEVDAGLTGFGRDEIQDLFDRLIPEEGPEGDIDPATLLDLKGSAITQLGEIIVLGDHRLGCGNATDQPFVERMMDGQKAALVATDPPYLVGYDGANRPGTTRRAKAKAKQTTWDAPELQPDLYKRFCQVAVDVAGRENAAYYCFHASRTQSSLESAWEAAGLFVHQQIIWAKERPAPGRSHYSWQHEPCFFGWKKPHQPASISTEKLSTVWELPIPAGKERPDHPTPKPVEAFCIMMRQHTIAGEICYEPFAGSGTQIIAAQKLGRRCFALELSPHYCDLIVRRYIAFVGVQNVDGTLAERFSTKEAAHASI